MRKKVVKKATKVVPKLVPAKELKDLSKSLDPEIKHSVAMTMDVGANMILVDPQIMVIDEDGGHKLFATFTDAYNYLLSVQAKNYVAVSGHDLKRVHFQF